MAKSSNKEVKDQIVIKSYQIFLKKEAFRDKSNRQMMFKQN